MRKFLLLLAVMLLTFADKAFSQTDITVGTGTATNTVTTYPCPLQDYYEGSRAQYLWLASELNAAGMSPGNINAIKFNVLTLATDQSASTTPAWPIEQLTIKITSVSSVNSLSTTTWENVPTVVYGPVDYTAVLGVNTFNFATPFFWNGTDNLIIEICNGDPNNTTYVSWTGNHSVPWTTGLAFNGSHSGSNDNLGNLCSSTTATVRGTPTTRPNIVFNWTAATACSGAPNPGTANVTPSTVCLGDPISLSATGVTVASGLTYQWEVSTNGGTSWSPIAGATTLSATTTQTVTSQYRLTVTCVNSGLSATTAAVTVNSPAVLGGTYIINKTVTGAANLFPNTNVFQSFNDAYNAIKCGISSAVIFNVAPGTGPYTEQLIMTSVKGASATNTVTFNGNGNVITYNATTANERAVIKLKGTKHIRFDGLVINANTGTYGYGVQLLSNSDSNIVRNCTINLSTTDITQNFAGIVINGTDAGPIATGTVNCDDNQFLNNNIVGGYYGITLVATFAGGANGHNKFYGNDIREFYSAGMYVAGSFGTIIDSNFFSRPTRTAITDFNGILFTAQKNTACQVTRNRITNPFGGQTGNTTLVFYGINFDNSLATPGAENYVANNLIYKVNGNGPVYGINNTGSEYVYYLHNTISLDDATATATALTRGFSQQTAASGIVFYDNLVTIRRGGSGPKHAIYLGATPLVANDYNNYYVNSASGSNYVGYFNGDRATLAAFQSATTQEANSLSIDPVYSDLNNGITGYTPVSSLMNNKGTYLGIDNDLLNNIRDQVTPDIGAIEYTPPPCVVPAVNGTASVSPTPICPNNVVQLKLSTGLFGSSQTFQWESSTSSSGPFTPVSSQMLSTDTAIMSPTVNTYYRVAARCAASTTYSNVVLLTVTPAMPGGTYTINKTAPASYTPGVAGGNFVSFNAAKAAMSTCGILGPVVFNVVSGTGPYNEQLRLDSIAGTSSVNTITFNGNGNTISFSGSVNAERAVIKLNAADYITFNNLVINALGAGAYGYGVQLMNNADSNRFVNCTINTSTAFSYSQNYAGVVINNDAAPVTATPINTLGLSRCDGNIFDGNIITGGTFGVAVIGSASEPINANRFVNNTVKEFLAYGFYIAGTTNTWVENNLITRPTRTVLTNPVSAIYMGDAPNSKLVITRNRITKMFGGTVSSQSNNSQFSGIYHNGVNQTAGNENIVSNNAIYDVYGSGVQYGIYNQGSSGVYYYNNTISFDNTINASATTRGFYQTTTATNIQFKNNIVAIRRAGTAAAATKYAIYLETPASSIQSDYNDFIVAGGGTSNYIGYSNGNSQSTLAAWQTATGKDANSLNLDPMFTDVINGDLRPQLLPLDNKGTFLSNVTIDILNVSRNNPPDMGAWEFTPPSCTTPPVAGTASVTPSSGLCLDAAIQLNVTGHSPLGQITFQWQTATSNSGPWTDIGPLQYTPQFNTTTTTSTWYRAVVTCTGVSSTTAPVQVTLNSILLGGTYTIDGTQATNWISSNNFGNFNTFQDAVNAMLCGIGGPVVFNVAAGTYNERIRIPQVPGTSAVNTVTFRAANGNASSATLSYSADATNNYTLKLDDAKYFTFRDLTISALNATNGRAIELANNASYDSILNCVINAPVVASTSNAVAGIYVSGIKGTNLTIRGNTINNGANGIYFAGTSTTTQALPGHMIDGNTVVNPYSHGIFAQFASRLVIRNNTVNITTTPAAGTAGINLSYVDSAFRLTGNNVNISNNIASGYGIQVANSRSLMRDSGIIASNTIYALSGNTNSLYGLTITGSRCMNVINNVIGINSAGASTYGLYNQNNGDSINYLNNTCNITAASAGGYAGYFNQGGAGYFRIYNNIFSNSGGGRALFVSDPTLVSSDYNMLYTSGPNLAQTSTGATTNFTNLKSWYTAWPTERWSIVYQPAFIGSTDLRPDLNNPDVWAMHGRGLQLKGNTSDFNGAYRPDSLTAGVPDLGAYEFFPIAQPTVLAAIPANPAPNTTQIFYYGSDTVMRITWKAVAPPSVQTRRFSGVVPAGLGSRPDSMFFYTKVDIPGGGNYDYDMNLSYIDPWQGSIPDQHMIGLGRVTPGNSWVVGFSSRTDVNTKVISQTNVTYLSRFTGLINPYAPPVLPDKDSSNRGRRFWVAYQKSYDFTSGGNAQEMVLYLSTAGQAANVQVKINGTTWVRNYSIPANTTKASDLIPKTGADDARLLNEGLYNRGISINSDVPITAYAHIYASTNSGATMLFPVGTWGYEYYTLNNRQNYSTVDAYTAIMVIADSNNTVVQITPTVPTLGGKPANVPFTVTLNKGEVYQVLGAMISGSEGYDLTGTKIQSISNSAGKCYPIGVFSGSTRTGLGCGTSAGSSGDLLLNQVYPYQAWGKRYLTAPTSRSVQPISLATNMTNIFRVLVKDPTAVVKRNGVTLSPLINGRYYQYESNTPDEIVSDKPIMLSQYMSSSGNCPNTGGDGDPSNMFIAPYEQAIRGFTGFYRNNKNTIYENFLTIIIPDGGMTSLKIDGIPWNSIPAAEKFSYPHTKPGYTVAVKTWFPWGATNQAGQSSIESDSSYTGIVYGLGNVESYGYNLGTMIKSLNARGAITNTFSTLLGNNDYTCSGTPFKFTAILPVPDPTYIKWQFSNVPNLSPARDTTINSPVSTGTVIIGGDTYYQFEFNQVYSFSQAGVYSVPVVYSHPDIEGCEKTATSVVAVQVVPSPQTDFTITFSGCVGSTASFAGEQLTSNGVAVNKWDWTFPGGSTATGQNTTFSFPTAGTFPVKLHTTSPDGCIGDSIKNVVVNPLPTVAVVNDSLAVCPNANATFNIQSPASGVTYNWYPTATGGTAITSSANIVVGANGVSLTINNVTASADYYVEAVSAAGCASGTRVKVRLRFLPVLAKPVVTYTGGTATTASFSWTAVPGAVSYEVSINNGSTWSTPSSGATGLTHTVSGLTTLQSVTLIVRANGALACQSAISDPVPGCAISAATVVNNVVSVCTGTSATFTVQSPVAGVTYNWYSAATGGTLVGTGTTFTSPAVSGTTSFYLEQVSSGGCVGAPRTQVTANILAPLAPTVITSPVPDADRTVNTVTFRWSAVPGAASYEVSVQLSPTGPFSAYVVPSSGATGLSHTVTGLTPLQQVCIKVRAIGSISCQTSEAGPVCGAAKPDNIFIPNTFTPNGDNKNDVLIAYGYAIQGIQFMVFNQWGEKIHEVNTNAQNSATGGFVLWDGKYQGKVQPVGVYVYAAKITLKDGTVINKSGALNIVR